MHLSAEYLGSHTFSSQRRSTSRARFRSMYKTRLFRHWMRGIEAKFEIWNLNYFPSQFNSAKINDFAQKISHFSHHEKKLKVSELYFQSYSCLFFLFFFFITLCIRDFFLIWKRECNKKSIAKTHLVEEPAAAGITGAAVGDVGEPDGFFWSSSEDSKDVCPACLRGKPNDSLLEAALVL